MTTLYRKYRPQSFSDLAGQEHIVQTIMNEVAAQTVAHAYLFSGPRGVGKTTMARLLAKAVNCERRAHGDSEPCNACVSCQEITAGRHIDVLEIDAASQTGVDNVRENIIDSAQFKPTKAKYKIFIIDEVHMLSNSAFNARLKTLEEPPAHVIFILATTELHKLPATVVSRCQRFTFKKIPYDQILSTLKAISKNEGVQVDEDVLKRVIAKSDGGMRDAESLLGQILSLQRSDTKKISADDAALVLPASDIESVLTLLDHLIAKDAAAALQSIESFIENGLNLDQFMLDCLDVLRTLMVRGTTGTLTETHSDFSKEQTAHLRKLLEQCPASELAALIDSFLKRRFEIRQSPLPQLPLELLVVDWCSGEAPTPSVKTTRTETAPTHVAPAEKKPATPPTPPASAPSSVIDTGGSAPANEAITKSTIQTTLDHIIAKWNELIAKIGESNHSLTFVLKMCRPKQINADGLVVTVPYSLHKEKLEEPKSRRIIEEAMQHLFAERIPVLCAVEPSDTTTSDLADVAESFGGEVVN